MSAKLQVNYSDISGTYDTHRSYSDKEIQRIIKFAGIQGMAGNVDIRKKDMMGTGIVICLAIIFGSV